MDQLCNRRNVKKEEQEEKQRIFNQHDRILHMGKRTDIISYFWRRCVDLHINGRSSSCCWKNKHTCGIGFHLHKKQWCVSHYIWEHTLVKGFSLVMCVTISVQQKSWYETFSSHDKSKTNKKYTILDRKPRVISGSSMEYYISGEGTDIK